MNSIICPIDLPTPLETTIDYFLNCADHTNREEFGHSHISIELHNWIDKLNLLEKSIIISTHLNSGFLDNNYFYKLIKDQYCNNGNHQKLFAQFCPTPTDKPWVFGQRNKKFNDGKWIGISSAPTNWSTVNRGVGLIYTLPNNSWTFKCYRLKNQNNIKNQCSVHSYYELELVNEIDIPGNSWYCIDFTQNYFTEEIWNDQLDRFMIVLR